MSNIWRGGKGRKQVASTASSVGMELHELEKSDDAWTQNFFFLIPGTGLSHQKACLCRQSHRLCQNRTQQDTGILLTKFYCEKAYSLISV